MIQVGRTVLIDACGWVALVDAGLNLDLALKEIVGKADLVVIDKVKKELDHIGKHRNNLLLDLLYSKSRTVSAHDGGHTDDHLLELSNKLDAPVLTVDKMLKRRLMKRGCSVIEIVRGKYLRLLEP